MTGIANPPFSSAPLPCGEFRRQSLLCLFEESPCHAGIRHLSGIKPAFFRKKGRGSEFPFWAAFYANRPDLIPGSARKWRSHCVLPPLDGVAFGLPFGARAPRAHKGGAAGRPKKAAQGTEKVPWAAKSASM
jgi:hypothetical protein